MGAGGNKIDMRARKNQKQWIVEVKGDYDKNTTQYNVNFDTGIVQLIRSISAADENINKEVLLKNGFLALKGVWYWFMGI